MTQVLELFDKNFKVVIIKLLRCATTNILETNYRISSPKNRKYNKTKVTELKNAKPKF